MFAIAVPTGCGDEARRNVEDRIAVNLQAFQVTYEQHIQKLIQDAVNPVRAYFDSTIQAIEERTDQARPSTIENGGVLNMQIARIL